MTRRPTQLGASALGLDPAIGAEGVMHMHRVPMLLGFFGWLMSLWCFYIILVKGKGPMGRFILLTYNLSALYAYSLSVKDDDNDDDEGGVDPAIWEIVSHRVVSVIVGVIWGIIAAVLASKGKKEMQQVKGLPQTAETVKEIPPTLKPGEQTR